MTTASAGAIDVLLRADIAQYEASMSKAAATAEREMQRTQRASQNAQKELDRLTAGVQREIETFGMTGAEIQKYEMRLRGASAAQLEMVDRLARMKDAQAAFAKEANGAGAAVAQAAKSSSAAVAEGMGHAGGATAGFTRELLVLGHELSQGNYKRFGGSLLVLAEYSGAATAALHALVGPIGIVVAAAAMMGIAFIDGAKEAAELRNSLILTGNYAGQTAGSFNALAHSVAAATNGTVGSVKQALQELVSTGRFGPQLLDEAAQAVVRMERVTGEDAQKIVADFEKMSDGVTKWASEHNRQWHFITAAQYESIRAMEEHGDVVGAQKVVLDALNEHLRETDKQLSETAGYWLRLKQGASEFFDWAKSVGAPDNIDKALAREEANLKALQAYQASRKNSPNDFAGGGAEPAWLQRARELIGGGDQTAAIEAQRQLVERLRQSKQIDDDTAKAVAASQKIQSDAVAASDVVRRITEENDKRSEATRLIEQYTAAVEKMRAAHDPKAPSQTEEDLVIARIRERYRNPDDKKLENAIKAENKALDEQYAKLQANIAALRQRGTVPSETNVAKLQPRLAPGGDLAGASSAEKRSLLAKAQRDDDAAQLESDLKIIASAQRRVQTLQAEAAARQQSAREEFIAQEIQSAGLDKIVKEQAERTRLTDALRKEAAAKYDAAHIDPLIQQRARQTDDAVAKLQEETAALTMNAEQRAKAVAVLNLQKQAQADIAKEPAAQGRIEAQLADDIKRQTEAIQQRFAVEYSGYTGIARAQVEYDDRIKNTAELVRSGLTSAYQAAEDAFVSFTQSGKISLDTLAKDIEATLARLVYRQFIAEPVSNALSSLMKSVLPSVIGADGSKVALSTAEGNLTGTTGLLDLAFQNLQQAADTLAASMQASSGGGAGGASGLLGSAAAGETGVFQSGGNPAEIGDILANASVAHSGGLIGSISSSRSVSSSTFAGATRYHSGGIAGLKPNEVPAILMGGPRGLREEVLHASDPRHRDNFGHDMLKAAQKWTVAPRYHTGGIAGLTPDLPQHGGMGSHDYLKDRYGQERVATQTVQQQFNVQVHNTPGQTAEVTQSRNSSGGMDIRVVMKEAARAAVREDLAGGHGISRDFAQAFGLNRASGAPVRPRF